MTKAQKEFKKWLKYILKEDSAILDELATRDTITPELVEAVKDVNKKYASAFRELAKK